MESKICDQFVSILIDLGSKYRYINPKLVDKCCLSNETHEKSCLVQLATSTKKRVHHWVRACAFELNGMPKTTHLTYFHWGSYNMLLGMD